MQYGFAIDQRTCIGCHACTVACKTEHEIPVGQFRTWVKYVDSGTFPDSARSYGVMRCNHCTDAPCITICPTNSLFKREDGIVDFDGDLCIGCKSCQQACPYDAIYIDDNTNTAAKCNFCAHRVDSGLEPACVVVCPTHSIWVGDLDDPDSGISQLLAGEPTLVRAPEQKTKPNVVYLGASISVLDPLAAPVDASYYSSTPDPQRAALAAELPPTDAKTTLNTAHPRPWGWRVSTYLWTKAVGAGALMVAALAHLLGVDLGVGGSLVAPALGVVMTAATGVLLVWDLKRPDRFYYILTKPNPRSWLFWGSLALAAFAGVAGLYLVTGLVGELSSYDVDPIVTVLAWLALPTGALAAGYTAFLFGQAEGRDLWQSRLLLPVLQVQAVMVGAGALVLAGSHDDAAGAFLVRFLVGAAALHVVLLLVEFLRPQHSAQATAAAGLVVRGRYAALFWGVAIGGAVFAVALAAPSWDGTPWATVVLAGIAVQGVLLTYESVFVRAGQDIPLS
ncbi:polysulfide reductase NrfD [soil metagenome]